MDILAALRLLGHAVTLVTVNTCAEQRYATALAERGIVLYPGMKDGSHFDESTGNSEDAFGVLLKRQSFDLAILTLWFWSFLSVPEIYMDKLWSGSSRTVVATLTDDRHSARYQQVADLTGSLIDVEYAKDVQDRERDIYLKSDLVLTISETEKAAINACAPQVPCLIIPFSTTIIPPRAEFSARTWLCMVANYSNGAARDAAQWFRSEISPIVEREIPNINTVFAGWHSEKLVGLSEERVRLLGPVEDLTEVFEATRVFVSPLRAGTGIATKNVVAMAHGVPVVTTSIGAQSLGVEDGVNMLIRDSPSEFARGVIRAYSDQELWRQLSLKGLEHAAHRFGTGPVEALRAVLNELPSIKRCPRENPPASTTRWVEKLPVSLQLTHQVKRSVNLPRDAYISAGFALLQKGKPERAVVQFRHALSFMKFTAMTPQKRARALSGLEQCYRQLGDEELRMQCNHELQSASESSMAESLLGVHASDHQTVSMFNGSADGSGRRAETNRYNGVSYAAPDTSDEGKVIKSSSDGADSSGRWVVKAVFERVGADSSFWKTAAPQLPEAAADYLTQSNEFLRSLRRQYAEISSPAMEHSQWSRSFIQGDVPLQAFRGDCAYVWQRRDVNLPVAHLLTAYYLSCQGAGELLHSLEEDNLFGVYTTQMENGKTLSRDLLDSVSEISFLEKWTGLRRGAISGVVDIGSGYGRFGYRLALSCPGLKQILCVDAVPESTFICDYYLRFRGVADKAHAIAFPNIERALGETSIQLATSIHCLDECTYATTKWWIELVRSHSVRYLFIVVNKNGLNDGKLLSVEGDGGRMDFSAAILNAGYRLLFQGPKYADSGVQRFGISPAIYSLYELSA